MRGSTPASTFTGHARHPILNRIRERLVFSLERFGKPDGRAHMVAVRYQGPVDDVRAGAPVYLVTGRVLAHYQSGAQTRRVSELLAAEPEPYLEIHPSLAQDYGISLGDQVRVTSARGSVIATARLSSDARQDTVFMPFHWAHSANVLTNDRDRPGVGNARIQSVRGRSCARVYGGSRMRRVVVIGYGMVGSRFVEDLVAADHDVHVTILGKEPVAAYNRVLLSISGRGLQATRGAVDRRTRPPPGAGAHRRARDEH